MWSVVEIKKLNYRSGKNKKLCICGTTIIKFRHGEVVWTVIRVFLEHLWWDLPKPTSVSSQTSPTPSMYTWLYFPSTSTRVGTCVIRLTQCLIKNNVYCLVSKIEIEVKKKNFSYRCEEKEREKEAERHGFRSLDRVLIYSHYKTPLILQKD